VKKHLISGLGSVDHIEII